MILALVDLADATARRGAATLVDQQLRAKPSSADDVHLDVAGAQSSYALGGSGEWERALVSAARLVRDSPADAARAVLGAAEHLRLEHDDDASCRAQSLFLASLLLESAPARSLDDETVEATMANPTSASITSLLLSSSCPAPLTLLASCLARSITAECSAPPR